MSGGILRLPLNAFCSPEPGNVIIGIIRLRESIRRRMRTLSVSNVFVGMAPDAQACSKAAILDVLKGAAQFQ
jgi:hypothetical protein